MRITLPKLSAMLLLAAACHDNTSPTKSGPPLSIVAGSGATDTVFAKLTQALIVEVRSNTGQPLSNVIVRFTSVPGSAFNASATIAPLTGNFFTTFVADSTDSRGQAAVIVQLGTVAGPAAIAIDVPELSLQDTATYTVLPGAAANLTISVRDTMVTPGAQYSLKASAADRFGNKRPNDQISFTSRSAVATVDASGKVTAVQEGRGTILVNTATATDSAQLSIVPLHELAVWGGGQLYTINTDGTQRNVLTTSGDASLAPQWSPDGTKVLIYEADPASNARLSTVDMSGARTLIVGPNDSLRAASYGRYTRDGSWIYFTGIGMTDYAYVTYRIKPDGTQLEQIGPLVSEGGSLRPDISPDGSTEIFQTGGLGGGNGNLGSMNIATHTIKSFGQTGSYPKYSPDGTQIAYLSGQSGPMQLYVMNSDGTNARAVSPPTVSYQELGGLGWSPDGQWLIAATYSGLDLVRVSDGLRLPLKIPGFQMAWKP